MCHFSRFPKKRQKNGIEHARFLREMPIIENGDGSDKGWE